MKTHTALGLIAATGLLRFLADGARGGHGRLAVTWW
jgi:hypothetical protein